jgi:hypothetical protein
MRPIAFLLNQPRDIPLALLLHKTAPKPLQVLVSDFAMHDEFGIGKELRCNMNYDDYLYLDKCLKESCTVCGNPDMMRGLLKECEVALSRGREFIIMLSPAPKNVALSFNRAYLGRLMQVMGHYGNRLNIMLNGPAWLNRDLAKDWEISLERHEELWRLEKQGKIPLGNPQAYYYDYFTGMGRDAVRSKLGIPLDKKVCFLSFHMADPRLTIYNSPEDFMSVVKPAMEDFKNRGYYIISRRRLNKDDIEFYQRNKTPDIFNWDEVKHLVDVEMNGTTGFPGEIWEGLFASDVMFLADISGIAYVEAALARCPVYMPRSPKDAREPNPVITDMLRRGLIGADDSDAFIAAYKTGIEDFLRQWYQGTIESFWKAVFS